MCLLIESIAITEENAATVIIMSTILTAVSNTDPPISIVLTLLRPVQNSKLYQTSLLVGSLVS